MDDAERAELIRDLRALLARLRELGWLDGYEPGTRGAPGRRGRPGPGASWRLSPPPA